MTTLPTGKWRVVVVARSVISSEGMTSILSRDDRFQVCAATHEQRNIEAALASCEPDLVLVEPDVERPSTFDLIKDIAARCPSARILVVSERGERVFTERALRAGATAYLVKGGTVETFLGVAQRVASKQPAAGSSASGQNIAEVIDRMVLSQSELKTLSSRELEVFSLIAMRNGTSRIMAELGISRKTVETHCEHIKLKLGYKDAKQLKVGARQLLGGGNVKANNAKPGK